MKDHYITFNQTTSAHDNHGTVHRGISSLGQGGPGRGRGGCCGGNDREASKPTQDKIDACTHIKAKSYESKEYKAFTPAKKAKHWQLMNPTKPSRGAARGGGGLGGGGCNGGCRYGEYDLEVRQCKTPSSTIFETSTKRSKYEDTTDDGSDLFLSTDDESTNSNRKNKALACSSPSDRQVHEKSEE